MIITHSFDEAQMKKHNQAAQAKLLPNKSNWISTETHRSKPQRSASWPPPKLVIRNSAKTWHDYGKLIKQPTRIDFPHSPTFAKQNRKINCGGRVIDQSRGRVKNAVVAN